MSKDIKITFEYADKTIRDPLFLGSFESDTEGEVFPIRIAHNSNKPIRDCGFYISEYDMIYDGTSSPVIDYDKVSWYADNYEDSGFFIRQKYEVSGEVFQQETSRLLDITRTEEKDFFSGFEVELVSGPISGEKRKIVSYDSTNNLFILDSDFSIGVVGESYKIVLETIDQVKCRNGSSAQYPIPLLYNGGKIDRSKKVMVELKMKIPPFMKTPGVSFFNLNLKYTPEEAE